MLHYEVDIILAIEEFCIFADKMLGKKAMSFSPFPPFKKKKPKNQKTL